MSVCEEDLPLPREGRARELWEERCARETREGLHGGSEETLGSLRRWLVINGIKSAIKLSGLWGRGRRNAQRPILREEVLSCPGLPSALAGLRVLHLSDFHLRAADPEFTEHVAGLLAGLDVDLCLVTGDYCYGHFGFPDHIEEGLARIMAGVTSAYGMYGVLGNHDKSTSVPLITRAGIQLLINEGVALNVRGTRVWIGGVDDPHHFRCASVPDALPGSVVADYRILLAHSPECVEDAVNAGANLYFCGHSHGGQIRLPGGYAPLTHTRGHRRYVSGTWRTGGMVGHTSMGLGTSDVPVRFNCRGEAVCFTLQSV